MNQEVTQLLLRWNDGDEAALEELTALVYGELRRRAAAYLKRESDADTLQATALVHEAYLQVLDLQNIKWQNRIHFVNTVAMLMRRILVDHARQRKAVKRGSGQNDLSLSHADQVARSSDLDLLELNEALDRFSMKYPRQAKVVELKFFGGLNSDEIAELLGNSSEKTSVRTVERDWAFARSWLHGQMRRN